LPAYAEAVFRLAKQSNALPAWSEALNLIATVYQDPQMQAAMANPRLRRPTLKNCCLQYAASVSTAWRAT